MNQFEKEMKPSANTMMGLVTNTKDPKERSLHGETLKLFLRTCHVGSGRNKENKWQCCLTGFRKEVKALRKAEFCI